MTIPEAVGMTRVDGFYIVGDEAFIVDSQGPIYANDAGRLGGSIYVVDWTNPCECADGVCAKNDVTWSPTVKSTITLLHDDESINDGGTAFRNSGIVVKVSRFLTLILFIFSKKFINFFLFFFKTIG